MENQQVSGNGILRCRLTSNNNVLFFNQIFIDLVPKTFYSSESHAQGPRSPAAVERYYGTVEASRSVLWPRLGHYS